MLKAVLDTNVIVSGIKKKEGVNGQILKSAIEGHFKMLISPSILQEVRRVLRYEKIWKEHLWSESEIERFLIRLAFLSELTGDTIKVNIIKEDAQDNRVLACALEGRAEYIVSGDFHLQQLEKCEGVRIISPSLFIQKLKIN